MRLEHIDIIGFGCLRNLRVDFHPRLTVIVGDNEAGKSTLQRAVRAALYGMDAGGQGRPVERSDWARWAPWDDAAYGLALTYALADGRRLRVARRLDTRNQDTQVLELGGSDLTEELRSGRAVTPGRVYAAFNSWPAPSGISASVASIFSHNAALMASITVMGTSGSP